MRSFILLGLILVGCGEDDKDSVTQAVAAINAQQEADEPVQQCPGVDGHESSVRAKIVVRCD
ncbi:MAG: hypothetical protein EOP04_18780 [Proteobacteria bacterium]|nr:MAG: hypothetical protein EOP04_18780 [Pseudomonadota bacterium]